MFKKKGGGEVIFKKSNFYRFFGKSGFGIELCQYARLWEIGSVSSLFSFSACPIQFQGVCCFV